VDYHGQMKSVVSASGRVTIPKRLRDRLGLRPGTALYFRAVNGNLVAEKALPRVAIGAWEGAGQIPGGLSVDEYLNQLRGCPSH
jgi:antitoxin PrlF